jgi:hypothetical protein
MICLQYRALPDKKLEGRADSERCGSKKKRLEPALGTQNHRESPFCVLRPAIIG